MDQWLLFDIVMRQRIDALSRTDFARADELRRLPPPPGLRARLGGALVRLGVAIDAGAGERISAARQARRA